ncbi:MAG TPA: UDP-glucuronic acid decarboxylase family protein [Dongiaceae bacterium]|jgi:UDP-glucuronate decarboxylase|nr:UDP-glucuronic acid decarboxylase family protein [Dongiaceae bacterium]
MLGGGQTITLVTGGAGFLGFNLCARLLDKGDRVVCLDDMTTGVRAHVDALAGHPHFEFIRHDVTEPIDMRVDRIFNLACPASPPAYQSDPIKTTLTSVLGVRNMLELARSKNARILHTSTSEIYGDPLVHPQTEAYWGNVNSMGPRSCYDEGKRCAETLAYDFHRLHGVDVRVARIFNTYGPGMRQDDGRAVSNFIVQALQNQDVTIYGDGSFTRSMCFVDDLIDGLLRLMEAEGDHAAPVNLGNPHEITMLSLAQRVIAMTGSKSKIVHRPIVVDDPRARCPDISRAKATLNWQPRVSLEEGLKATIAFFEAELAHERAVNADLLHGSAMAEASLSSAPR